MKDETARVWEMTRDGIKHEDDLRHKRLAALLTVEGFLVGGFFVFQGQMLMSTIDAIFFRAAEAFVLAIFLIGIVLCFNVHRGMMFADDQLKILEKWWVSHTEWSDREQLPAVMGVFETPWFLDFTHIPVFLAFLNGLCAFACLLLIACGPLHGNAAASKCAPGPQPKGIATKTITVDDDGQLPPLPPRSSAPTGAAGGRTRVL